MQISKSIWARHKQNIDQITFLDKSENLQISYRINKSKENDSCSYHVVREQTKNETSD